MFARRCGDLCDLPWASTSLKTPQSMSRVVSKDQKKDCGTHVGGTLDVQGCTFNKLSVAQAPSRRLQYPKALNSNGSTSKGASIWTATNCLSSCQRPLITIPSTKYLRTLVPKYGMVFGTRHLTCWVLGPSGNSKPLQVLTLHCNLHSGVWVDFDTMVTMVSNFAIDHKSFSDGHRIETFFGRPNPLRRGPSLLVSNSKREGSLVLSRSRPLSQSLHRTLRLSPAGPKPANQRNELSCS